MAVKITQDEMGMFQSNGINPDNVKSTVERYRTDGLSDDEIRGKIDTKLQSFSTMQGVANNPTLNSQQKADKIQQMGEAERAGYDKDLNAYKLKATAGAGLAIGGQALDLVPFVGPTLGGAAFGAGNAMINNGSGKDIAKEAGINGLIAGVGAKVIPMIAKSPAGKFVGEKIGTPIADAVSPVFNKIGQGIEDKFGVNFGNEITRKRALNPATDTRLQAINTRRNTPLINRYNPKYEEVPASQWGVIQIDSNANKQLAKQIEQNINAEKALYQEYRQNRASLAKEYGSVENLKAQAVQDLEQETQYGLKTKALKDYRNLIEYEKTLADAKYIKNNINPTSTREVAIRLPKENIQETTYKKIITPQGTKIEAGLIAREAPENVRGFGPSYSEFQGYPQEALSKLMQEKSGFVPNATSKDGIGNIDFVYGKTGKDGFGLSHIKERRTAEGINSEEYINNIPDMIKNGEVHVREGHNGRKYIVNNDNEVVIRLDWNGKKRNWLTTAYNTSKNNKGLPESNPVRHTTHVLGSNLDTADGVISSTVPNNSIVNEISQNFNPAQSKFTQTVKNSELAAEDLKSGIGDVSYGAKTNKQTLENARNEIDLDQAAAISKVLNTDIKDAEQVATAIELSRKLQNTGNVEDLDLGVKILRDLSAKLSNNGQIIQAASMYSRLTPEGALRAYINAIDENIPKHVKPFIDTSKQITSQLQNAKTADEAERIIRTNLRSLPINAKNKIINQIKQARETGTLDENVLTNAIKSHFKVKTVSRADIDEINALTSQIVSATNEREKEVATALLQRKISEVKPVSLGRKISTVQAGMQLLNPKTMTRNLIGNGGYGGILENITQASIGAPLDDIVSKFTGEKSLTYPNLKTQLSGLKKGFKLGVEDVKKGVDTSANNGKYDLFSGRTFRDNGLGAKIENAMNYTLRVPDRAAYQAVYDEAIENMMKARGITSPTNDILEQAHQEALQRTFQDESMLAKLAQGFKKGLNLNQDWGLGDLVLKYAKTPANILDRGLNYSPIGLAKGGYEFIAPSINKSMPFNQRNAVMSTARGLMGTGIMGVGVIAANNGIRGERNDNLKLEANLNTQGEMPYSFKMGDRSYTYDWAVPASIPFSAGANYDNKGDAVKSILSATETLQEQPLLQGLKAISGNGFKGVGEGVTDVVTSIPQSFVPSLGRQIAQTIDPYVRETRNAQHPYFSNLVQRPIANIPLASYLLPEKYDITGQPVMRDKNPIERAFNVGINPMNTKEIKNDDVLNHSLDLYDKTDDSGALLANAKKSFKQGDEQRKLTNEELSNYQKDMGQISHYLINRAINNPEYMALDSEEQVKYIEKVNRNVNQAVKMKLFKQQPQKINGGVQDILDNYENYR